MKTKLNFFFLSLAFTALFAACSTIETAEPEATFENINVGERFCELPLSCNCPGTPYNVNQHNWRGATHEFVTPRCNNSSEYREAVQFNNNLPFKPHYVAFFDEKTICEPRQKGENIVCEKRGYDNNLWIDNNQLSQHIVTLNSTQEILIGSFKLLGVAPEAYHVTYLNELGLYSVEVDFSPYSTATPDTYPSGYLDETMMFTIEWGKNEKKKQIIISGYQDYEDGITFWNVDGQDGDNRPEDLVAIFHATDFNSSIITFRSTEYRLSGRATIFDGNCKKTITGLQYEDGVSTYLRIPSQEIFQCIWPTHEEFNFEFSIGATKL